MSTPEQRTARRWQLYYDLVSWSMKSPAMEKAFLNNANGTLKSLADFVQKAEAIFEDHEP